MGYPDIRLGLLEIDRLIRLQPMEGSEDQAWLFQMGEDLTRRYDEWSMAEKARVEAETGRLLGIPPNWRP